MQSLHTSLPEYRDAGSSGPDHHKVFNVNVYINGTLYGKGQAYTKKDAHQAAAKSALKTILRNNPNAFHVPSYIGY